MAKKKMNFDPKKADRNKDGKLDNWEKAIGKKVAKGKATKGGSKSKGKSKGKPEVVGESLLISNFVTAISNKNYAEATKYLTRIANEKIKARISDAINEPLF
jgi:hypothetical protein